MFKRILFVFLCWTSIVFSQNSLDKTIYIDSLGREVPEGKHLYSRLIKEYASKKDFYDVLEFYNTGKLHMEGRYEDNSLYRKKGDFTFYYENGNPKSKITYNNNIPDGNFQSWYENGEKQTEGKYENNTNKLGRWELIVTNHWDKSKKQKVVNGNGFFEDDTFKNEIASGEVKNGLKVGKWTGKTKDPNLNFEEYYENGKITTGNSTDSKGNNYKYNTIRIQPEPKKGIKDFYQFVGKNFRIPEVDDPSINKIRLMIAFVVDKDGTLSDFKVFKGYNQAFENEAIRVIKEYGEFETGYVRGMKVKVHYSLPITIQIDN